MSWRIIKYIRTIVGNKTIAGTIKQAATTGTPDVVTVTSSASANTFGSYTQLVEAVSADSWVAGFTWNITASTVATPAVVNFVIEIGTGAEAAESTIIRYSGNVDYTSDVGYRLPVNFSLPVPIKIVSGTRLSARASTGTADAMNFIVGISYYQGLES